MKMKIVTSVLTPQQTHRANRGTHGLSSLGWPAHMLHPYGIGKKNSPANQTLLYHIISYHIYCCVLTLANWYPLLAHNVTPFPNLAPSTYHLGPPCTAWVEVQGAQHILKIVPGRNIGSLHQGRDTKNVWPHDFQSYLESSGCFIVTTHDNLEFSNWDTHHF